MPTTTILDAQAADPIRYTLRFPAPHTHYVEVEAVDPTARQASIEIYMATWTPGSYLIREYERNVEAVTAVAAGKPAVVAEVTKNRWKITTGGAASVTLRYKVYSREMTVRNNWVEAGFAMLNGAPTFITLVETGRTAARGAESNCRPRGRESRLPSLQSAARQTPFAPLISTRSSTARSSSAIR